MTTSKGFHLRARQALLTFIAMAVLIAFTSIAHADPLHDAAKAGDIKKVKSLLNKGANVNAKDKDGYTPLHVAAVLGHTEISKLLINIGADVNAKDIKDGHTPLHYAVGTGQTELAKLLINGGANVNVKNKMGETPLDTVRRIYSRDPQMIAYLERVFNGSINLHDAAKHGDINTVKKLLNKGANINAKGGERDWTPLLVATVNGQTEIAKLLINGGANVNAKDKNGNTPLHAAAFKGPAEIAKLLINNGANAKVKNKKGETPLDMARGSKNSNPQTISYLESVMN